MPCEDDRPLSQAEREAGFRQQRTGVPMAVRRYLGPVPPGMQPLIDYLNREVIPAVQRTRDAVNEVYLPVVDNSPSGNPLGYYFSTETGNADPTSGRLRLNQASQETATVIRVSQDNGRLQDVAVFLDIMSGSATSPLGVVTLTDSINPGRFIRFDLTAIADQGAYWDLTVTPTESSHENPFVDGEAVVLAFMPGVGSTPATVPVGSLAPIADETFLGNLSGSTAAPSANLLSAISSASVAWSSPNNRFERAALSGDVNASGNSNATAFRLFSARSVLANSTNANAIPTELQGSTAHHYLKVAGTGTTLVFEAMTLASFPTIADDTFLANISGATAVPTAVALTTLAGAGLTGGADAILNVGAGTGITVNANDVQLSTIAARSVLANATNATAAPSALQGATAHHLLKVNSTNTALVFEGLTLAAFPTIADDTFLANISGGAAVPTAVALTTLAGAGLTGGADAVLAVGAGTGITVNANDVQLTTIADDTFMANVSGAAAVATGKTFASLAGDGLAYDATNHELDVTGSTSIVVTGDQVTRAALTGEVTASANSNATTVTRSTDFDASPWTGPHEFDAQVMFDHRTHLRGIATVSTTGTLNNLSVGDVSVVRFTGASSQSVTGIVPTAGDGQILILVNATSSESQSVTLANESASSTAANRILTSIDQPSAQPYRVTRGCVLWYDGTSSRWRLLDGADPFNFVTGLFATQALQETGSSTTIVTGSVQRYHPSALKAFCCWAVDGSDETELDYGVSSVTDNGTGDWTVNFSDTYTSAFGLCVVTGFRMSSNTSSNLVTKVLTPASSSSRVVCLNASTSTVTDPSGTNPRLYLMGAAEV